MVNCLYVPQYKHSLQISDQQIKKQFQKSLNQQVVNEKIKNEKWYKEFVQPGERNGLIF